MNELEDELDRAGAALTALASGPGEAAAKSLEEAFARTGKSIQSALSSAAQTGELDFQNMTKAILADLARIAAEAVISQSGLNSVTQNISINPSAGSGEQSGLNGLASLSTVIAAAASRGGDSCE